MPGECLDCKVSPAKCGAQAPPVGCERRQGRRRRPLSGSCLWPRSVRRTALTTEAVREPPQSTPLHPHPRPGTALPPSLNLVVAWAQQPRGGPRLTLRPAVPACPPRRGPGTGSFLVLPRVRWPPTSAVTLHQSLISRDGARACRGLRWRLLGAHLPSCGRPAARQGPAPGDGQHSRAPWENLASRLEGGGSVQTQRQDRPRALAFPPDPGMGWKGARAGWPQVCFKTKQA